MKLSAAKQRFLPGRKGFLQTLSLWKKHKVLSVLLGLVILCLVVFLAWYFQPIPTRTVTGQINGRSFSMEVPKDWDPRDNGIVFHGYRPNGTNPYTAPVSMGLSLISEELGYMEEYQNLLRQMLASGDTRFFEQRCRDMFYDLAQFTSHRVTYHKIPMMRLSYRLCQIPEWGYHRTVSYYFQAGEEVYLLDITWEKWYPTPPSRILKKAAQSFQWTQA